MTEGSEASTQPTVWQRVRAAVAALGVAARRPLAPLASRAGKDTWWVPVAVGIVLLAVSAVALMALGSQLKLMHLPTEPGYAAQGFFSKTHLHEAVKQWTGYWFGTPSVPPARVLGGASPQGLAVVWLLLDLLVFIPGYVMAGGMLLLRTARNAGDDGRAVLARGAASLLVVVALLDVVENLATLGVVACTWPDVPSTGVALAVGLVTIAKYVLGGLVLGALVLLGLRAWNDRSGDSAAARATLGLLRGNVGLALAAIVLFNLPIQLPDVFLSLGIGQILALVVAGFMAAIATWSVTRWVVLRHESRSAATPVRRVLAAVAAGLLILAIVNWRSDGNPMGPAIPLLMAGAVAAISLPLRGRSDVAAPQDLGGFGVAVPQGLAAGVVTFTGAAATTALANLAVARDDLILVVTGVVVTLGAVALVAWLVERLDRWLTGAETQLRTMSVTRKQESGGSSRLGAAVAVMTAVVAVAAWCLLADRVGHAQGVGAAAVVLLFLAAANLLVGAVVVAADAWEAKSGIPPLFAVMGRRRIPVFTLLLVWGVVAAFLDDGQHFDVRLRKSDPAPSSTTLAEALEAWVPAPATSDEGGDDRRAVPLVIVATSGGGIRSAYWTALAMDCLFVGQASSAWDEDHPCGTADSAPGTANVFLASGISGGSLGLVEWDASREKELGAGWVADKLDEDFVAPTVAWGLLVEVPRSFLQFEADDRAEVLEESWEAPWGTGEETGLRRGFLASQGEAARGRPLLLLNGSSVSDGCALNVSLLDAGSTLDQQPGHSPDRFPMSDCLSNDRYVNPPAPELPAALPATADLVDYLVCENAEGYNDVRLSTAALLSARFPYVSSAGRLEACDVGGSTKFILDGGIVDTSAAEAAVAVYLAIEPLVEEHNADPAKETCIVPYFVQLDNDYVKDVSPRGEVKPPNQLIAPFGALSNTTGLASRAARARALAAALFTQPFRTAPGNEAEVTGPRYANLFPRQHPGVEAPLGWTLSEESRDDLRRELYVNNAATIQRVHTWFTSPATCAALPTPAES
jgi:hypothetical protein